LAEVIACFIDAGHAGRPLPKNHVSDHVDESDLAVYAALRVTAIGTFPSDIRQQCFGRTCARSSLVSPWT